VRLAYHDADRRWKPRGNSTPRRALQLARQPAEDAVAADRVTCDQER
jgi:hypothetical protein